MLFEFGGLPTNTQPEIIEYSAFWKADILRVGSVLRFYTASANSCRSVDHQKQLKSWRSRRGPARCRELGSTASCANSQRGGTWWCPHRSFSVTPRRVVT